MALYFLFDFQTLCLYVPDLFKILLKSIYVDADTFSKKYLDTDTFKILSGKSI